MNVDVFGFIQDFDFFIVILDFSVQVLISLVKYFPKYFILFFDAIINIIVFLISFLDHSLLACRNAMEKNAMKFFILILCGFS